jgi:hypothetical protein
MVKGEVKRVVVALMAGQAIRCTRAADIVWHRALGSDGAAVVEIETVGRVEVVMAFPVVERPEVVAREEGQADAA